MQNFFEAILHCLDTLSLLWDWNYWRARRNGLRRV